MKQPTRPHKTTKPVEQPAKPEQPVIQLSPEAVSEATFRQWIERYIGQTMAQQPLYAISITSNDRLDEWFVDANSVVFTTSDKRIADLQCRALMKRYGSSNTTYEVKSVE